MSEEKPEGPVIPTRFIPPPNDAIFKELVEETSALADHVGRHGNILVCDPKDDAVTQANEAAYKEFLAALNKARTQPDENARQALLEAYAKITAITFRHSGVNGRTILDTLAPQKMDRYQRLLRSRNRPLATGIILFLAAMIVELMTGWAGRVSDPTVLTSDFQKLVYQFTDTLASFLIPAIWGAIGACVFLMKRLSDKLFAMAYEAARQKGDGTRIFLGAMLGVIVVVLIFPDFHEEISLGDVSFGPAIAAFLAGLGIKPVYLAFETLSEQLSNRISGKKDGENS